MDRIKERQKLAWEGLFYSVQRIDLLIISLCSAGIYVSLETLKYLSKNNQENSFTLKVGGVFFLLGIIINFLSQTSGFNSNKQEYLKCLVEIDCFNTKSKESDKKIRKYDKAAEKFSDWTNYLNTASMIFMFAGLITITSYFLITF